MFTTFCVFQGTLDKKSKTLFTLPGETNLQVNEEIYTFYNKYYYTHKPLLILWESLSKLLLRNDEGVKRREWICKDSGCTVFLSIL